MVTSPILLDYLLEPMSDRPEGQAFAFITSTEQLVYASAFVPPIIYMLIERFVEGKRKKKDNGSVQLLEIRNIFSGYLPVLLTAFVVLFTTVAIYTASKTNFDSLQDTRLYVLAKLSAPIIYVYALYCWYLTILDGLGSTTDPIDALRANEAFAFKQFEARISEQELES